MKGLLRVTGLKVTGLRTIAAGEMRKKGSRTVYLVCIYVCTYHVIHLVVRRQLSGLVLYQGL